MQNNSIIEALYQYFKKCPLMKKNRLNVNFLPDKGVEYSIDTVPVKEITQTYIDHSTKKQYVFVIRSVNDYDSDTVQAIANSGFFEQLSDWMDEQTKAKNLPVLPSPKIAQSLESLDTGYLPTAIPGMSKYAIQCKLTYYQQGER